MSILFISYAHEDEEWRKLIESQLKVLELNGQVRLEVWSDLRLQSGCNWKAVIEEKLEGAIVAVLILTSNFANSEFIMKEELPYLISRWENQSLKIIPILARSFAYDEIPSLKKLNIKTAAGRPLLELPDYEKDALLSSLVREIKKIITPVILHVVDDSKRKEKDRSLPSFNPQLTLEVSIRHRRGNEYHVGLDYTNPKDSTENHSVTHRTKIDQAILKGLRESPQDYACALERRIFPEGAPKAVRDIYNLRLQEFDTRLRVNIEPTAGELHGVFWETLQSSNTPKQASNGHSEVFVRSVSGTDEDWPSPALCAWPRLKVWMIHLERQGGSAGNGRLDGCAAALKAESILVERSDGANGFAGLETVDPRILLLSVHMDWSGEEPMVFGRSAEGTPTAYSGEELAKCIQRLSHRPQVIILDSADDATNERSGSQVAESLVWLASELIATGVCAVVTRQAPLSEDHWLKFLIQFLLGLKHTGNVDLAAGAGRQAIGQQDDWKPVVLTRLRTGQLWYRPMFLGDSNNAWQMLVHRVKKGQCIPIIGPLVSDHVMRSRADISEKIAQMHHYPGRRSEKRDLRKVAQYVATTLEPSLVRSQYEDAVRQYLIERYSFCIDKSETDQEILVMLKAIWDRLLVLQDDDPHMLLARLKLPLYLSTNLHNYLSLALTCCSDAPRPAEHRIDAFVRERIFTEVERIYGEEEDCDERTFALSNIRPLVYHLFGRLDRPQTMILTEDDHFRFLLRFPGKWARFPSRVRSHFSDSALLFLGFDLGGWEFRSIFRALLELAGSDAFRANTHVAVQVSADDDTFRDPERAQNYLVKYFNQISVQPQVFLGSAQEFLTDLNQRLR